METSSDGLVFFSINVCYFVVLLVVCGGLCFASPRNRSIGMFIADCVFSCVIVWFSASITFPNDYQLQLAFFCTSIILRCVRNWFVSNSHVWTPMPNFYHVFFFFFVWVTNCFNESHHLKSTHTQCTYTVLMLTSAIESQRQNCHAFFYYLFDFFFFFKYRFAVISWES